MTRKHYTALAAALGESMKIAREHGDSATMGLALALGDICNAFQDENPRFDRKRFTQAVIAASGAEVTA
jgi:hypothetical protein